MRRFVQYMKRQRGDTIVEVLISITVVSLILGSAFITTNKSLQATRSTQERSNALKLAESQVEQLKGAIANPTTAATIFSSTLFCLYTPPAGPLSVVTLPATNCTVDTGGTPTINEPKFNLSITRVGNDFTVKSTWNNLSGTTTLQQVTIKYRAYQ